MIYISKKEKELYDLISKIGCITMDQLKRMLGKKYNKNHIEMLINKQMIKKQESCILALSTEIDKNILAANELLISLFDKISWYSRTEFPYIYMFYMNDKAFDIAVIDPDDKLLIANINNSNSQRIIAIIDNVNDIEKIKINKPIRYCTIYPLKYYYLEDGQVFEEK